MSELLLNDVHEAQKRLVEAVGMEASAVDLHPQELLQPYVGELDARSEVVEQRELAGLLRCLEEQCVEAKGVHEALGGGGDEVPGGVEDPNVDRALARFDYEELRTRLAPPVALLDE